MNISQALLDLVDQRIRRATAVTRAIGTCVDRYATGPGALVQFDGSDVAVPVKVAGHVMLRPEQRCFLDKYGSEWIVTSALGAPALGMGFEYAFASTDQISTSGMTDMPSMVSNTVEFTKYHDNTGVKLFFSASGYTTLAGTAGRWAIRFVQTEGELPYTPVDMNGPQIMFSTANVHLSQSVRFPVIQGTWPAGKYTGTIRWRRTAGSGFVAVDANDLFSIMVEEFVDPTKTIL